MAIKYCDHGAYSQAAEFQAQVNANGNTLTVTGILSGKLTLGMEITGLPEANFPWPVHVSAFGTGTGGTGSYTLSYANRSGALGLAMYTGIYGGPSVIPSWAVPQDGDGLAKGPSTSAATASIVFSGVPSGTISVCGVTISPSWGASADSAANALATAINASTTVASSALFSMSPQLRSAVYARGPSTGAPSGTCQLMTRTGSSTFNGQVAIAHTLTNVNSGSSSLTFSGGVSGCWGWLFNVGKIWPSLLTEQSYGLLTATTCYAGSIAAGDTIHIRSGKVINYFAWSNGGTTDIVMPSYGTTSLPTSFIVDDSTIWNDGTDPVLNLNQVTTIPHTIYLPNMNGGHSRLVAKKYSDSQYGMLWSSEGTQYNIGSLSLKMSNVMDIQGIHLQCGTGGGAVYVGKNITVAHLGSLTNSMSHSRITQQSQLAAAWLQSGSTQRVELDWSDIILDCGGASASQSSIVDVLVNAYATISARFTGIRFVNFVTGSKVTSTVGQPSTRNGIVLFRNTDWGNVTVLGPVMGQSSSNAASPSGTVVGWGQVATSQLGNRDFFIDTPKGWCAWVSTRAFPTLNAKLHDGITPWSMQIIPTTLADNIAPFVAFESPRLVKINSLATGIRTLTMNFGIEQSLLWGKRDVSILIEYEDESGSMVSINTFDLDNEQLDTSSAAWTNADGEQFTYSETGVLYFNKKSISVTTPTPIKTGTEIGCYFRVHTAVADTTKQIFIDPELVVV